MEAKIGTYRDKPWETVASVAYPRYTWGPDLTYKSVPFLIETFARVASGNGNYLLGFIPDAEGRIPQVQKDIAAKLGGWVHENSEAIFKTRGGPYYPSKWGGATRKANKVFIFILAGSPERIVLPSTGAKLLKSRALNGAKVDVLQNEAGLTISLPNSERDERGATVVELTLDRPIQGMLGNAADANKIIDSSINLDLRPIEERTNQPAH